MNLLIVISFAQETVKDAEAFIDHLFHNGGRNPDGIALLVASSKIHAESRERLKLAADLAFNSHSMIQIKDDSQDLTAASKFIAQNYRTPFLWVVSKDFRPEKQWLKRLVAAYESQEKRYFLKKGSLMGVYPNNAADDAGMDILLATRDATQIFETINKK